MRGSRYLFELFLLRLMREELDFEPLDARALDFEHLETAAVVLDLVALLGRSAQEAEDEAADRVVVLDRQGALELLVEVVDRERPVDAHPAVGQPLDRLVREIELVLDLADDLLEQILERDDPLQIAVLVDHDRHVLARAPELAQKRREVLR